MREILITALIAGPFALVVFVALGFRRRAIAWEKTAKLTKTAAEFNHQTAVEFKNEANYWRALVTWQGQHVDRAPTEEDCEEMWQKVVERNHKRPSVARYSSSLDALIRESGARPS